MHLVLVDDYFLKYHMFCWSDHLQPGWAVRYIIRDIAQRNDYTLIHHVSKTLKYPN